MNYYFAKKKTQEKGVLRGLVYCETCDASCSYQTLRYS